MRFDTENLPAYVRNQLRPEANPANKADNQIVKMLSDYGEMDVDEVVVCFWAVFKRKIARHTVTSRLYELLRDGRIKRIKRGLYAPLDEDNRHEM